MPDSFLRKVAAHYGTEKPVVAASANGHYPAPDHPLVKTALDKRLPELAAMAPGSGRNTALNLAARYLGRFPIDRGQLRNMLLDACAANGVLDEDGERTCNNSINSGFRKADEEGPRVIEERVRGNGEVLASYEEIPPPEDDEMAPADERAPDPPLWGRLDSRLLDYDALQNLPEPQPLIDNVLDQGTVALLYGKWGTCKTFIAIDWACSVATGRPWQARSVHKRKALYVAAEGAFGYRARMAAWTQAWKLPLAGDAIHILPIPVNLTRLGEMRELAALIAHHGYGFVGLDTLARCMVGGDENSARDCGIVVDAMCLLREATPEGRGVICGVHHAGKDGKTFRGSSAFEGGADTVYFTDRDGAMVTLEREKRRDGPTADHHELRLDEIESTGSAIIIAGSANSPFACSPPSDRSAKLLNIFVQHFAHIGATKSELREIAAMNPATFYRSVNDLLEQKDLINMGTNERPFYMLHPSKDNDH